jgi:hypothetical protein
MKFFMDWRIRIAKNKQNYLKYNEAFTLQPYANECGSHSVSEYNGYYQGCKTSTISYSIYNIYL